MHEGRTRKLLAEIADAGWFEALATAVLREEDPRCRRLVETGTNVDGKTVNAIVDGIQFVDDKGARHMVAVQHTTCERRRLKVKWLGEPQGDVPKAVRELIRQRRTNPEMGGTLILTTNKEPPVALIGDLEKVGREAGMKIRVFGGSTLAHFLDFHATGQWIRARFLGVQPTQLSPRLLRELSVRSVGNAPIVDEADLWVKRQIDVRLARNGREPVEFFVGESGSGKTVACIKCLRRRINEGGFGLVLTDEVLRESVSIEDAVDRALRELQPSLTSEVGAEALRMGSETAEMLFVVEDINRASQAARLVERLANWSERARRAKDRRWRVLCPVWPRTLALADYRTRELAGLSTSTMSAFTEKEGIAAVQKRRPYATEIEAKTIACRLGLDPLLIALHADAETTPDSVSVIKSYVDRSLEQLATLGVRFTAGEYRSALRTYSLAAVKRLCVEPVFDDLLEWDDLAPILSALRDILTNGEVLRLDGPVDSQRVAYRHDRVRYHLFAEAVADALSRDELPESVLCEPYFAEVIGLAASGFGVTSAIVERVAEGNALGLFCALRQCGEQPMTDTQRHVVAASMKWVEAGSWRESTHRVLRAAVLRVLSECDGAHVRTMCEAIGEDLDDEWSLRGRFRNGDVLAGVRLCAEFPPGVGRVGHVELIEHVAQKGGGAFVQSLDGVLRRADLTEPGRRGILRLAGFVGSSALSTALRESWAREVSRLDLLADYLWACARCCGSEPTELLEPIFDSWATLSDEDDDAMGSPRERFGAYEIRFAFRESAPRSAVPYFLRRAENPDLRGPILSMLGGIDDPAAIEFLVREVARIQARAEATGSFYPFASTAADEWSRRETYGGSPMSDESRGRLHELWSDNDNDRHLRRQALRFWSANQAECDIAALKSIGADSEIGNMALFERLRRRDRTAIPLLVHKLHGDESGYWWQAGRFMWTEELTDCLDSALAGRSTELSDGEAEVSDHVDWILPELLAELPTSTAEQLITRHWEGLRNSREYVQVALYVASEDLLQLVSDVVEASDNPGPLFEHLSFGLGLRIQGRRGITRLSQMEGLVPYLQHLSDGNIALLWDACNRNRWFAWRRRYLDERAKAGGQRFVDDAAALSELDKELETDGPIFPLDHWVERYLGTGISLGHMMEMLSGWIAARPQEKALLVAAEIVTRFGKRSHADLLRRHALADSELGHDVIADAAFELRLRSLE